MLNLKTIGLKFFQKIEYFYRRQLNISVGFGSEDEQLTYFRNLKMENTN